MKVLKDNKNIQALELLQKQVNEDNNLITKRRFWAEEELDKNSTCQNFWQVRKEGNRTVNREILYYNLI